MPFDRNGTIREFSRVVVAPNSASSGPFEVVVGLAVSTRGGPTDASRPGTYVMTLGSRCVFGSGSGDSLRRAATGIAACAGAGLAGSVGGNSRSKYGGWVASPLWV